MTPREREQLVQAHLMLAGGVGWPDVKLVWPQPHRTPPLAPTLNPPLLSRFQKKSFSPGQMTPEGSRGDTPPHRPAQTCPVAPASQHGWQKCLCLRFSHHHTARLSFGSVTVKTAATQNEFVFKVQKTRVKAVRLGERASSLEQGLSSVRPRGWGG